MQNDVQVHIHSLISITAPKLKAFFGQAVSIWVGVCAVVRSAIHVSNHCRRVNEWVTDQSWLRTGSSTPKQNCSIQRDSITENKAGVHVSALKKRERERERDWDYLENRVQLPLLYCCITMTDPPKIICNIGCMCACIYYTVYTTTCKTWHRQSCTGIK